MRPSDPARARRAAATRSPMERLSSADARLAQPLRHVREIQAGAREDRREAGVEHAERPVRASSRWSQPGGGSLADQREEAAVVLVARALRRVHRVRVAPPHDHHLRAAPATAGRPTPRRCRGPTPTGGSARARRARADRARRAGSDASAWSGPRSAAGPPLVGMVARTGAACTWPPRRLGDARDAAAVGARPPPPPARPGHVARGGEPRHEARAEGDVRDHPFAVARPGEALELRPRPRRVELRPAERRERRVPVPLVRVGGARRQRVPAGVVAAQDRGRNSRNSRTRGRLLRCSLA